MQAEDEQKRHASQNPGSNVVGEPGVIVTGNRHGFVPMLCGPSPHSLSSGIMAAYV